MDRAKGCDYSKWQDDNSTPQTVNFEVAKKAGLSFVFIKASQAAWMDEDFAINWKNAKAAGLPRGAYHFLDWSTTANAQADFFSGLLRNDAGELPPVVDYEMRVNAPSRAVATDALHTFMNVVEQRLGRQVMVYTAPGYWGEFWDGRFEEYFESHRLWIAHYYVQAPTVPRPWTEWEFWQWGLGKGLGPTYGAESLDVDMDWYKDTEAVLWKNYNLPGQPPTPPPPVSGALQFSVAVPKLNVRSGPGTRYSIVGSLEQNATVTAQDVGGGDAWIKISNGWVCVELAGTRYLKKING